MSKAEHVMCVFCFIFSLPFLILYLKSSRGLLQSDIDTIKKERRENLSHYLCGVCYGVREIGYTCRTDG